MGMPLATSHHTQAPRNQKPTPPTDAEVVDAVAKYVRQFGVNAAVAYFGLGREAVARIIAGLKVRRGTFAQARERMVWGASEPVL